MPLEIIKFPDGIVGRAVGPVIEKVSCPLQVDIMTSSRPG
jgi:hypothetical protein